MLESTHTKCLRYFGDSFLLNSDFYFFPIFDEKCFANPHAWREQNAVVGEKQRTVSGGILATFHIEISEALS